MTPIKKKKKTLAGGFLERKSQNGRECAPHPHPKNNNKKSKEVRSISRFLPLWHRSKTKSGLRPRLPENFAPIRMEHVRFIEGEEFDSSYKRGTPTTFKPSQARSSAGLLGLWAFGWGAAPRLAGF